MKHSWGTAVSICALLSLAAAAGPGAQQGTEYINNFKYNIGQGVQPIFQGWSRAGDGSINMHFGYLNRNYVETPHIPIGPNNFIEPDGPDRGQPTFFYTRTQRNLFTVTVPKDWPLKREVIWTLTVNGKTEKAFGWLRPEWEVTPTGDTGGQGNPNPESLKNQPPALKIDPIATAKVSVPAPIVATIIDDGLPKPQAGGRGRRGSPVGQETPPTLRGGVEAPVNVPQIARGGRGETPPGATAGGGAGAGGAKPPPGPTVSWIVWRGPADATFSRAEFEGDKRKLTATFTKPGEYVLRAVANDTQKSSAPLLVKVAVQ
jgi:hypothetical protein